MWAGCQKERSTETQESPAFHTTRSSPWVIFGLELIWPRANKHKSLRQFVNCKQNLEPPVTGGDILSMAM